MELLFPRFQPNSKDNETKINVRNSTIFAISCRKLDHLKFSICHNVMRLMGLSKVGKAVRTYQTNVFFFPNPTSTRFIYGGLWMYSRENLRQRIQELPCLDAIGACTDPLSKSILHSPLHMLQTSDEIWWWTSKLFHWAAPSLLVTLANAWRARMTWVKLVLSHCTSLNRTEHVSWSR